MVDTVVIPAANNSPSLEDVAAAQDAAAAAKAAEDPKLAGEGDTPVRPDHVPEKFWNAETGEVNTEALLKSYSELEKGGEKPADKADTEAATKAVTDAGLNMEALSAEYAEKGELTPESLEALSKVGITPEMVNAYAAGQDAILKSTQAELLEPLGGDVEKYDEMTAWAGDNLSDAEIDSFNSVLESGNNAAIKLAVADLATKFNSQASLEPSTTLSGKAGGTGLGVYESTADLMKDMNNPDYARNPAFRAKVEAKLSRSNIL